MKNDHPFTRFHQRWLIACMVCVVLMVFIGGVTRLTESGLSIVEWKLVSGTFPPLSEEAWAQEFAEYKTSPEFNQKNAHFSVNDFKKIYWLEYIHRLMGRITGLVFLLPLLYFAVRKSAPAPFLKRMTIITALIGAQGAVGWIMVASGLEHQPRVSPIKLALHLSLALSVFGLTYLTYLRENALPKLASAPPALYYSARGLLVLVAVQIILGAIVAGTDAGYSYNTYPLMDGRFVPEGLFLLSPWWLNLLENITTVQFQHRMGALILINAALGFTVYAWKKCPELRTPLCWLFGVMCAQFILGVATLLSVVSLPLASAHQLVALALMACLLRIIHALSRNPAD